MSTPTGSKPSSVRSSTRLTPPPGSRPTCPRRRCGGPALADFAGARWADDEAARLDEVLRAIERRLDAELALGHHKAVVAEVEPLVAAYPLRERLCGQLMLGLYRSGRQAEALRAFAAALPPGRRAGHHPQP